MLVSKAEMSALKIAAVYMDTPAKMLEGEQGVVLSEMLERGYLKFSNDCSCLRLSAGGAEILRRAEVDVKEYVPQSGRALARRLQGSQVALFLSSLGVDVFQKSVPKTIAEPVYLASAELRRQKCSNVLGMSKFLGLLYAPAETFAVYNVSDSAETLFPATDEDVFTRELICGNSAAKILYLSQQTLAEMSRVVVESAPAETSKHGCTFVQAIGRFNSPVSLISTLESANQMRVMPAVGYREKLARFMLGSGYSSVNADFVDAKFAGGYFLVFIDFDIKRLEQALRLIKSLHILVLSEQLSALDVLLKNRKAEIYAIDSAKVFEVLDIPEPVDLNSQAHLLKEGGGVIATKSAKIKA
jgi:hypothetical protein